MKLVSVNAPSLWGLGVKKVVTGVSELGPGRWLFEAWRRRVYLPLLSWPYKPIKGSAGLIAELVRGKGLEIGGPSGIFRNGGQLPVYPAVRALDNCNFSHETVWEGALREGDFAVEGRVVGRQYVCEATLVGERLGGREYDYVLSSNCLEHVANPLKAIEAWLSLLRPGGRLVLAVPNKAANFDRLRPVTDFRHLVQDYENDVGEDDRTHFDEVIKLTDLRLTSKRHVGDRSALRQMVEKNLELRCVHHHIFDAALLRQIAAHFGLVDVRVMNVATDFVLVARRGGA